MPQMGNWHIDLVTQQVCCLSPLVGFLNDQRTRHTIQIIPLSVHLWHVITDLAKVFLASLGFTSWPSLSGPFHHSIHHFHHARYSRGCFRRSLVHTCSWHACYSWCKNTTESDTWVDEWMSAEVRKECSLASYEVASAKSGIFLPITWTSVIGLLT